MMAMWSKGTPRPRRGATTEYVVSPLTEVRTDADEVRGMEHRPSEMIGAVDKASDGKTDAALETLHATRERAATDEKGKVSTAKLEADAHPGPSGPAIENVPTTTKLATTVTLETGQ